MTRILKEVESEELAKEDQVSSTASLAKKSGYKRKQGLEESPGESSKRRKTKSKPSPLSEPVAKECEEIIDTPSAPNSHDASGSGQNPQVHVIQTRSRANSNKM